MSFRICAEANDMELVTATRRCGGVGTALPKAACNIPIAGARGKYGELYLEIVSHELTALLCHQAVNLVPSAYCYAFEKTHITEGASAWRVIK